MQSVREHFGGFVAWVKKSNVMGPRGLKGLPGREGPRGKDAVGLPGPAGRDAAEIVEVEIKTTGDKWKLVFLFSDGSELSTNSVKLPKGSALRQSFVPVGLTSGVGAGGDGADGKSAYDLWIAAGNTGTIADFLDSLIGRDGVDGTNGIDGDSAYDIWLANGNTGTEQDFLASLDGVNGIDGIDGVDGVDGKSAYQTWLDLGNVGTEQDFIDYLKADAGASSSEIIENVLCQADVFEGAVVRMTEENFVEFKMSEWPKLSAIYTLDAGSYDAVAVNAQANNYDSANVIGVVENKISPTRCRVRISGVTAANYLGLDVTKEYFLSDLAAGVLTVKDSAPTAPGTILIKIGGPTDSQRLLLQIGERLVRA